MKANGTRLSIASLRAMIVAVVTIALLSCAGYVPGRQAYWDARVTELCSKDGGVTVYQKVRLTPEQLSRGVLPTTADGRISVAIKALSHPEAPVYAVDKITMINERNPRVTRVETAIVRRSDETIVAKRVRYARFGGDFPTGISEASSFLCPDAQRLATETHQSLFEIDGGSK